MLNEERMMRDPLRGAKEGKASARALRASPGWFVRLTLSAVLFVITAVPGAQIGSILSHRASPRWLRTALAVVIALAASGMIADVVGGRQ
jgi:uncharacterized membrane protein YfcA